MKIPSYVPLVASERRGRESLGFLIEVLTWGYIGVVLGRILFGAVVLPRIEDLAYDEAPVAWAARFMEWTQYDSRYPGFEWGTLGFLFLAGMAVGAVVGLTGRGVGPWLASISKLQVNNPEDSLRIRRHWAYARKEAVAVLLLTLLTGWVVTKIEVGRMFEAEGLIGAGRLALQLACGIPGVGAQGISLFGFDVVSFGGSLFDVLQWGANATLKAVNVVRGGFGWSPMPEFQLACVPADGEYYSVALSKLAESVYLAFMATFFAIPVAFLLAFFAARNLTNHSRAMRAAYLIVRTYMNITRSIEPIIWAILFSVWIGIGPFAGAIALMMHSISSLVKLYSEAIEAVDPGPIEAIAATGANRVATAWFAVVPQVILPYLAFTIYRWDINVRMATIIGLVGGGGIGGLLIQEQGLAHWTQVGTIAFLIFIVVWAMDFLSARIREAIS